LKLNTVLITGANRGLGLEFVRSYAAEGWRVHACCRHPEKAKALSEIAGDVAVHKLDVTDGLPVASLARELAGEPIDILINNAGVFHSGNDFGEIDYADWVEELKVNTVAPARMVERFVEQVAASERKLIVNISSGMGSIGGTTSGDSIVYRSSKAGLNMVVKCLSLALAERGITVVALSPGWVSTDMSGPNAELTPAESIARMRAVIDRLTPADNGHFFNHEGEERPW
jgi:NAD(P)-dependent dehydrogenase (short-subunit alcohol dehydrogenase family)